MNYMFIVSISSLATAIILGMSGCSSSDGTTPVDTTPTSIVDPITITNEAGTSATATASAIVAVGGRAIDGYLVYATVCLDLNNDGYCQIGDEPATSTDVNGSFHLSLTDEQRANSGYSTAPLLVYGGYDIDTNTDFIGKLKATFNEDAEVNITPLTTMVEAMVSAGEDEAVAEAAVVSMLGLPQGTDLRADPIAEAQTDPALLVAALQLQKSLEILAEALEASGATDSQDDLLEGLYSSLATQLAASTDLSLTAALGAVVAADDGLDSDALDSANEISGQIELIIGTDGVAHTAVIGTQIGAVREELVVNVINGDDSVDDLDLNAIINKDFSLLHAEKILHKVNFYGTDAEFDTLALKVQTALKSAGMSESAFLSIEAEVAALKGDADADVREIGTIFEARISGFELDVSNLEILLDYKNAVAVIEDSVIALIETTAVADVDDAKTLVTQIRESVTSFVDIDADRVENNTSTILGSQVSMITDKIQPAVETIASDFNASVSVLESSVTAFSESLELNFKDVLGSYDVDTDIFTPGSIENRLMAIAAAENETLDSNTTDTDWNARSSFGDTLAYTYVISGTTVTETFTFNNETITISWEDVPDGDMNSITTSGEITFAGTGYDLKLSSFDFTDNKFVFTASGTITGVNDASMTLSALDIAFDIDEEHVDTPNMFANIEATFDGTIVSSGRTLAGKLVVNESVSGDNQMIGSYTGAIGEPSFEGTLTLDTSLDDVKTLIDDSSDSANWINPNSLLMVTYDDGEKSFVVSYGINYNNFTESYDYLLYTQNGDTLECNISNEYIADESYTRTVLCSGGSVEAFYGDDKIITLTIDDVDYTVEGTEVWSGYIYLNNNYFLYNDATSLSVNMGLTDNGMLAGDTQNVIISDISMRNAYAVTDMDVDFSFSGSLTHGTKVIRATVKYQQLSTANDMVIMAENVAIEDGTNFVKFDSLAITVKKTLFDANYGEQYYDMHYSTTFDANYGEWYYDMYDYSTFDSFTININADVLSDYTLVSLDNLAISITDTQNNDLTFDADISYTMSLISDMPNYAVTFNGTYSYADTVFTGLVDVTGNESTTTAAKNLAFTVAGNIEANGFEPFGVAIVGNVMDDQVDGYALYTRGTEYKLGLSLEESYDEEIYTYSTTINLADSNGVMSEIVETWTDMHVTSEEGDTCYMHIGDDHDNEVEMLCSEIPAEDSSMAIILTDKDGTQLAEFGEDATGNGWEISYSDNSSETLF